MPGEIYLVSGSYVYELQRMTGTRHLFGRACWGRDACTSPFRYIYMCMYMCGIDHGTLLNAVARGIRQPVWCGLRQSGVGVEPQCSHPSNAHPSTDHGVAISRRGVVRRRQASSGIVSFVRRRHLRQALSGAAGGCDSLSISRAHHSPRSGRNSTTRSSVCTCKAIDARGYACT